MRGPPGCTSTLAPYGSDQRAEIDRLVPLGATHKRDDPAGWAVMADPDGNPFCLLSPVSHDLDLR